MVERRGLVGRLPGWIVGCCGMGCQEFPYMLQGPAAKDRPSTNGTEIRTANLKCDGSSPANSAVRFRTIIGHKCIELPRGACLRLPPGVDRSNMGANIPLDCG